MVTVAANLDGLPVDPNLLEVALLWDGVEVGRSSHTQAQLNVGLVVDVSDVLPGTHTVAMTVIRQSASPWRYDLNGSVFVGGAGGERISLGHTEAELATGETVSTQVTITAF